MLREVKLQAEYDTYVYCEEDKIGEGGFGSVYLGRDINNHISVAIKRPHFYSQEALERFKNKDCRYLPKLRHKNIVKVLAILTEVKNEKDMVGSPALIMEYIPGKNLQMSWDNIKYLKQNQKLELFSKICEAVEYAHQQGIIHRDLKPGNILVTNNYNPKIIDFGLAASLHPEEFLRLTRTQTNQFMGSLLYMAPEQQNARKADKKSDIYSLGLILFFIFTGKHARELLLKGDFNLHQIFDQYLRPEIASLCKRACQGERHKRITSVRQLTESCEYLVPSSQKHMEKNIYSPYVLYSGVVGTGILIGSVTKQVFYQTVYWRDIQISITVLAILIYISHLLNIVQNNISIATTLISTIILGLVLSGYLVHYPILVISYITVGLWSYLLYRTIRN